MAIDEMTLVQTAPGTLAGRYLRKFWQPVYRAQDLPAGRAVPVRIMSEEFTLYRGESGVPYLVAARCAHRGTQLSTGWVEQECLRCRYHGWKYDGSGQCVEQPGEDENFAAKVRIASYPVQEYLGLIWAYLGDGDSPPLRRYRDFEGEGVLVTISPERWPCNYYNRLDNDADAFHVVYTHQESIGRAGRANMYTERTVTAEEAPYGIKITTKINGKEDFLFAFMPNSNQIRVRTGTATTADNLAVWEDRLILAVPEDDENSWRFEVNHIELTGEDAKAYLQQFHETRSSLRQANELGDQILAGNLRIEDIDQGTSAYELFRVEDYVTEVGQGIVYDRAGDHLGRQDAGVILRRKLWRRELSALADGKPLTDWVEPAGLGDFTRELVSR